MLQNRKCSKLIDDLEHELRIRALSRYYLTPNICLYCGSIIYVAKHQKVNRVKKKKFCNNSCAASYNNRRRIKKKNDKKGFCILCNRVIRYKRNEQTGKYHTRKFCTTCLNNKRISSYTKEELRTRNKSYRQWITRNARTIYTLSSKSLICAICGYSLHVDICHIVGVAKFADEVKISEINALDNLIALCPNHHREFDNEDISI